MFNHIRNYFRRIFHLGNPYCPFCNQHLNYQYPVLNSTQSPWETNKGEPDSNCTNECYNRNPNTTSFLRGYIENGKCECYSTP